MQEKAKQPEQVAPNTHHPTHALTSLFQHNPYPYKPRNVNTLRKAEQAASGTNTHIAVGLTKGVGTMWTAYAFAVLAIVGLLAILGVFSPLVALLVVWASQTFIQLVMLPILSVGQNVLGHHAELQADEQFNTTQKSYHDLEEVMLHLAAQDAELLKHTKMLIRLLSAAGITPEQVSEVAVSNSTPPHETPPAGEQTHA